MECPALYINNHFYVQLPGCKPSEFSRCYTMIEPIDEPRRFVVHYTTQNDDGTFFLLCTVMHGSGIFYGLTATEVLDGRWKKDPNGGEPTRVG